MTNNKVKVEEEYEEKDLRTHIYETTDTYAGSDQIINAPLSVMRDGEKTIQTTNVNYIPVIYKMFDEIIVNAISDQTGWLVEGFNWKLEEQTPTKSDNTLEKFMKGEKNETISTYIAYLNPKIP